LAAVNRCDQLSERFGNDPRLQFYVAPLAPFLDPRSGAFEDPAFGYRKRFTTPEEHRLAPVEPRPSQVH
jgi:hypothetical protein